MDVQMVINGEAVGKNLKRIEVMNPATNEIVGTVPEGGEVEAKLAVDAADHVFDKWAKTTVYERADLLRKLFDLMHEEKEVLAELMTKEMGKPISQSLGEVNYAASFLDWFAEEGKRLYGRTIPTHAENKRIQVWHKPVGIVFAITPWNFPIAMITRKLGPAIAAGCPIIIKPPQASPLTAIKFMELVERAGFPKGVINVVTGKSSEITNVMMKDKRVRKITFTGSTAVGKKLIEQSAYQVKKLSLELGGHAPAIVFKDANIDLAVKEIVAAKFRNGGQTCVCVNRIYVHDSIYNQFAEKYTEAVKQLQVGDGQDENDDIGPLVNEAAIAKVETHVQDALEKGATLLTGGKLYKENTLIYEPTVIGNVRSDMIMMQDETFGPLAPIQSFTEDHEAIQLANDTPFGLASYIFTDNLSRGMLAAEQLDYGIVGWNDGLPSTAQAPFGGMKESGYGREGGIEGIEAFVETQYVSIGLE